MTMTPPAMLDAFAQAHDEIPTEAIAWARANWAEAAPPLHAALEAYVSRADRSERAQDILFYGLLLMMTQRDEAAHAPLARLAREADALYDIMGDSLEELLPRVFAGVYDGDVERLWSVVEASHGDEGIRVSALLAYVWLVLAKRIPHEDAEPRIAAAFAQLEPQEPGPLWSELAFAAASLGLLKLWPLAKAACRKGLIPARIIRMRDLEDEFRDIAADFPREAAAYVSAGGPLDSVFEDMAKWAAEAPPEGEEAEDDGAYADQPEPGEPLVNPLRTVGRNDPCPCGSGKKFKKCCAA
jgi:hypothetical protein